MKTRLIEEIGTRVFYRVYESTDGEHLCDALVPMKDMTEKMEEANNIVDLDPAKYDQSKFPTHCEVCGKEFSPNATKQIFKKRLYNTASGKPEPGDMYFEPWYHGEYKQHYCPWDNCNDPRGHLMVVLPNGRIWDTDSRASNCTRKDDRTHRCWVKHGEPPNITVDKNGDTCHAGAGSILAGDYHGFLRNGELTNC